MPDWIAGRAGDLTKIMEVLELHDASFVSVHVEHTMAMLGGDMTVAANVVDDEQCKCNAYTENSYGYKRIGEAHGSPNYCD